MYGKSCCVHGVMFSNLETLNLINMENTGVFVLLLGTICIQLLRSFVLSFHSAN